MPHTPADYTSPTVPHTPADHTSPAVPHTPADHTSPALQSTNKPRGRNLPLSIGARRPSRTQGLNPLLESGSIMVGRDNTT